ncbi:hypothetical protein V8F20_004548 [Naviculisporaceae sp. PSN 640]
MRKTGAEGRAIIACGQKATKVEGCQVIPSNTKPWQGPWHLGTACRSVSKWREDQGLLAGTRRFDPTDGTPDPSTASTIRQCPDRQDLSPSFPPAIAKRERRIKRYKARSPLDVDHFSFPNNIQVNLTGKQFLPLDFTLEFVISFWRDCSLQKRLADLLELSQPSSHFPPFRILPSLTCVWVEPSPATSRQCHHHSATASCRQA